MVKKRNGIDDLIKFLGAVGSFAMLGYFLLAIWTASAPSEAQKYFAITIVFFIILVLYIELVVKKKVKT